MRATGDWEIDLSYAIVKIANELARIADALEDFVYDDVDEVAADDDADDDDDDDDGVPVLPDDPSDGPFLNQEESDSPGFADLA